MLHTFEHDGRARRLALFFSADWPARLLKSGTKPVLLVHLHDRDEGAIEAMRATEYYTRLLHKDKLLPPFVLLFPEGVGGTTARPWEYTVPALAPIPAIPNAPPDDLSKLAPLVDLAPPPLDAPFAATVQNHGMLDQATSSWNVPSALGARLSGADDPAFVRRCVTDTEQFCRAYLADRHDVRWTGSLFDTVIVAGKGVGAELAASFASRYPERCNALVLYSGTAGTVVHRGRGAPNQRVLYGPSRHAAAIPMWMVHAEFDARYPPDGGVGQETLLEVAASLGIANLDLAGEAAARTYAHGNISARDCLDAWLAPYRIAAPAPTETSDGTLLTYRPDGATPVEQQVDLGVSVRWNPDWVDRAVQFLQESGVL